MASIVSVLNLAGLYFLKILFSQNVYEILNFLFMVMCYIYSVHTDLRNSCVLISWSYVQS